MKITETIYESLSGWGDHPAVMELQDDNSARYVSASQLKERIDDASRMLRKYGIMKGFIVAVFLNNSIDFILIWFALAEIGAIPITVNMAYRTIELDEIFSNANPHAVIAEQSHLPVISNYVNGRIIIERVNDRFVQRDTNSCVLKREQADIDESTASINYTYRGYGYPLGAMVPHAQYQCGAEVLQTAVRLCRGERLLVLLPMPHIFTLIGCVFLPLMYGITPVISHSRNPLRLFEYIRNYTIHNILAVPELYELIYKLRDSAGDCSPLKAFLSGGSVLPEEMFDKLMKAFNVDLIHGYGLTEFTPVSRNMRGNVRPGTIGVICDGLEYKIDFCDATGAGEILIRTDNMTRAYYKRPSETRNAFENGWFRTGDIGRIEDNNLVFMGEKKGTRKVKGNMVDLEEVRRTILQAPDVRDAIVDCSNNIVSAKVDVAPSMDFNSVVLHLGRFMEMLLANYKIPKEIKQLKG